MLAIWSRILHGIFSLFAWQMLLLVLVGTVYLWKWFVFITFGLLDL
jgi:hypothetical protein